MRAGLRKLDRDEQIPFFCESNSRDCFSTVWVCRRTLGRIRGRANHTLSAHDITAALANAVLSQPARYQLAKRGNSLRVMAEAVRWGKRGARINTISPGIIFTPLARDELTGPRGEGFRGRTLPAARSGTPDEVGGTVALLMGSDGAFITGSDFLMERRSPGCRRRASRAATKMVPTRSVKPERTPLTSGIQSACAVAAKARPTAS